MNRIKLKEELKCEVARDKFDLPLVPLKNIKYDVFEIVSKYAILSKNDVKMKVQVLKNGKYNLNFEIFIDEFID